MAQIHSDTPPTDTEATEPNGDRQWRDGDTEAGSTRKTCRWLKEPNEDAVHRLAGADTKSPCVASGARV